MSKFFVGEKVKRFKDIHNHKKQAQEKTGNKRADIGVQKYNLCDTENGKSAFKELKKDKYDLVLCD